MGLLLSIFGIMAKRNSFPFNRRSSDPGGATHTAVGPSQAEISTHPELPG